MNYRTEDEQVAFIIEETGARNEEMVRHQVRKAGGNLRNALSAVKAELNRMNNDA